MILASICYQVTIMFKISRCLSVLTMIEVLSRKATDYALVNQFNCFEKYYKRYTNNSF